MFASQGLRKKYAPVATTPGKIVGPLMRQEIESGPKKPASSHRNGSLIIAMTQHWRMPDRKSMRRINRIVSAMTSRWSAFQLLSPSTLQNRATPARRAQQRRIDAFVSH